MDRPLEELSLEELQERLRDVEGRIPAHSVKPAIMAELEEIEDEIARRKKAAAQKP